MLMFVFVISDTETAASVNTIFRKTPVFVSCVFFMLVSYVFSYSPSPCYNMKNKLIQHNKYSKQRGVNDENFE